MVTPREYKFALASAVLLLLLIASGIRPCDRATWLIEVLPVMIALPLLWATYRGFLRADLAYALGLVRVLVLIVGGAYTYARVLACIAGGRGAI